MLGISAIGALPLGGLPEIPFSPPARVGWFDEWNDQPRVRRRHTPEELEAKLAEQRNSSFGRRWFDDFIAAQNAAIERAENAMGNQQAALTDAINATSQAAADAIEAGREPGADLTAMLHAAAVASKARASARLARKVVQMIEERERERADAEDDEIAVSLLLQGGAY